MSKKLNIMVNQLNPTLGALKANSEKVILASNKSMEKDIDLLVFPEMFLTGYQLQDLILKKSFQRDVGLAIDYLAKKCEKGAPILLGAPIVENGHIFNAGSLLERGKIKIVARQIILPNYDIFDENRIFSAGGSPQAFKVGALKVGCIICEDAWHPEVSKMQAKAGADIIVCLNGSPYERDKLAKRELVISKRAKETKLPIIYVNLVGGQDDQVFDGGSFACNNKGQKIVQFPQFIEKTDLIVCDNHRGFWEIITETESSLGCSLSQDYQAIVTGTKDYIKKSGFKKVVIGLSGGIDSALVATLAADAIGPENVLCVRLPSSFSSAGSLTDAKILVENLGCRMETVAINDINLITLNSLKPLFDEFKPDTTEENIQSRIRGMVLMALSNKFGCLLLTTGNKSEVAVGYATIYGDMNGGYNPIKDLYKTRVFKLAHWRNTNFEDWMAGPRGKVIPVQTIEKAPSAELRFEQKDEDSLPPYKVLDEILEGFIEKNLTVKELKGMGFEIDIIQKIESLIYSSEYKRYQSAPGVHLTQGSFWLGRRYPMVQKWRDSQ